MSTAARQRLADMGLIEWFRIGDVERVEQVIEDLRNLRVRRLRTQFSWADWHTPEGARWYAWLLPRLAAECEVLPCFSYTPPSLGIQPRTASPPRDDKAYADFLDHIITLHGEHFEWVELWNEPNNLNDWDWHLDHDWQIFSAMIGKAAYWVRQRGKKALLGGMCPTDPNWLALMGRRGVLDNVDAVGLHGFPGTWDFRERSWQELIDETRGVLDGCGVSAEIWITEAGYSTWRHDDIEQLRQLRDVLDAPADRIYWYSAHDLHDSVSHQDGFHEDERHYHFGLRDGHGRPKLAYRLWADGGFDGIEEIGQAMHESGAGLRRAPPRELEVEMDSIARPERERDATLVPAGKPALVAGPVPAAADGERPAKARETTLRPVPAEEAPVLITGGAGFIGTNLAARLLSAGRRVLVYDNLSRPGVEHNLHWLRSTFGENLQVEVADVRDPHLLRDAVSRAGQVFHLAAQVAVTSSLEDPRMDFEVNLRGTLNLLEAIRSARRPPPLVFTSTNKVYGALDDVALDLTDSRYQPRDRTLRESGIGETRSLDFHSPYGCSKGGADQYVLDYARSYGLATVVLRMSCIYGPHQFGNEDQGWVAHFLIRALEGRPITLYGDGMQVRDILFVEDLVDAFLLCQEQMPRLAGRAFNMGGGPANTVSLVELLQQIGELTGVPPKLSRSDWRTGDQRYYVSDTRAFAAATGWKPRVDAAEGVRRLHQWLSEQRATPAAASGTGGTSAA